MIDFELDLAQAKERLGGYSEHDFFVSEVAREMENTDDLLERYGEVKFAVVSLLNEKYGSEYRLENWVDHKDDEVAYFIIN